MKFAAADDIVDGRFGIFKKKVRFFREKTIPGEGFPLWLAPEGVLVFSHGEDENYLDVSFWKRSSLYIL